MSSDESFIDHAEIGFVEDMANRNKRLVVHHYASRSHEDYTTKVSRGAGDHERNATFRNSDFLAALIACVPSSLGINPSEWHPGYQLCKGITPTT
jgi:hypothetical protein